MIFPSKRLSCPILGHGEKFVETKNRRSSILCNFYLKIFSELLLFEELLDEKPKVVSYIVHSTGSTILAPIKILSKTKKMYFSIFCNFYLEIFLEFSIFEELLTKSRNLLIMIVVVIFNISYLKFSSLEGLFWVNYFLRSPSLSSLISKKKHENQLVGVRAKIFQKSQARSRSSFGQVTFWKWRE